MPSCTGFLILSLLPCRLGKGRFDILRWEQLLNLFQRGNKLKKVIEFPITQNARHFNVSSVFVLPVFSFEPAKGHHPGDCALPVPYEIVS